MKESVSLGRLHKVVDVNSVEHTAVFEIPSASFVGQYVVSDEADFSSVRYRDKDFGSVCAVSDDVECDEIVTVEKVEFGKIASFGFARVGNCVFHRVHLRSLILPFGKSGGAQTEKNVNCVFRLGSQRSRAEIVERK